MPAAIKRVLKFQRRRALLMPDASKSKLAPVLRAVAPPLFLLIMLLSLWQFSVWWFDLKPFLVPSPVRVATAAYSTD